MSEDERPVFAPASKTQQMFLQNTSKFTIYGGGAGSGKSHLALMYILGFIHDPNFRAVFIRETLPQIEQSGGLWQEAQAMYKHFGARFRTKPNKVTFPSGAVVTFTAMGSDRDIKNFDGGQYSLVVFDEAQYFSQVQVSYLESRIRSKAKGPHRLICTCNPLRDSFLYKFVSWYLDPDTGIPLAERSGVERYYAQIDGDYVFGDSVEELVNKHGPNCKPQTYTFISATIYDNPHMALKRPDYVTRLENLKRSERERLLLGSWHAKDLTESYWKSEWCELINITQVPLNLVSCVRGWDLAATEASEANRDPDYSCGVKLGRDKFGTYYILDAYRFRKQTDGVLKEIVKTSKEDGDNVFVTIPKDTGAGGKSANVFFVRYLAEAGISVKSVVMSGHTNKIQRFLPFASVSEAGIVKIVRGEWNDWFINELENFTGGRQHVHDDAVDAVSDAFNTISKSLQIPTFAIPDLSKPSVVERLQ